jgi:hypothetical protein
LEGITEARPNGGHDDWANYYVGMWVHASDTFQ